MIIAAFFTTTFCLRIAHAQSAVAPPSTGKSNSEIDLSLGVFGQSTATRTKTNFYTWPGGSTSLTQDTQGNTNSVGVLGTFHQSLRPWLGYNLNIGYTRLSAVGSSGSDAVSALPSIRNFHFARGSVGLNMYELTAAPVVQGPRINRITTFAQLGGGLLIFLPTEKSSPYGMMFRPTMVIGAGVNYKLSPHWALRAEYRGLLYNNPDVGGSGLAAPRVKLTHEPTVSIVYRFGGKR
jgi:opacity protein-like surface antigen